MFVARDPEWSGPEIDIGTMAALVAMINAKKNLGSRVKGAGLCYGAEAPSLSSHPDRGALL
jgi:hypothetical protein